MASYDKIYYNSSPIGSISALATTLDVSQSRLEKIAADSSQFYLVFQKQVGKKLRTLCDPIDELKRIQKKIISRIFSHLEFPPYLHGGIKASDPRDFLSNATHHARAHIAVAIDVENFFPSISENLVETAFRLLFNFKPDVATLLAKLTTLNGSVPQGAPTSTYLSNFIMFDKEYRLVAKLKARNIRYTRLIDDITLSSDKPLDPSVVTRITTDVVNLLSSYGFRRHEKKYKIYTRSNPHELMTITGLWLNRGVPRIAKSTRDEISAKVVALSKKALRPGATNEPEYHEEFASLSGRVAVLHRLKHTEGIRLRRILRSIPPIYDLDQCIKLRKIIVAFSRRSVNRSKLGYIRKFYRFQYCVAVMKNSNPKLAKQLQRVLNAVRPTKTLKDLNESNGTA
ncbi:reverse transcriptase family protein [Caballeronia sp. LjRoot34]|uniref:reverse transcriptase family protein n=1 Tax=Caballeronia sp. LjRoot34 TaxID=3342325 RepID=UPI003ECE9E09